MIYTSSKKFIYKLLAVFIAAMVVLPYNMVFANPANMNTNFDVGIPVGFDGAVNSMTVQNDGKILVVGDFTTYKGASAHQIIRLNADGSRDTSFDMGDGLDGRVYTIQIQSDGKILVGGNFVNYKGVSANRIIRLNSDGSKDTSFDIGSSFNLGVQFIEIQSDGKILVGGGFTSYNGSSANNIIRLNSDGSRDTSFDMGNGFDGRIYSIKEQSDGKILVGGWFTTYKGVSANNIIRLNSDGSRDTSFDMGIGFDSMAATIEIQSDGKILVGGQFTTYKGVSANNIIRLNSDGSRDTSFDIGTGFDREISSIKEQSDGKLLVGGYFSTYNGVSANNIIRLNSDGSRDTSFDIGTGLNGQSKSIKEQSDGKILVLGDFTIYKGDSANYIIRLNVDGSRDTSFDIGNGLSGEPKSIKTQSDGKILVGGGLITYRGDFANYIMRLNTDGGIDNSFNIGSGFNSTVRSIDIQNDGKILVGGAFTNYKGVSANRIIRLNSDGSRDTSFDIGTGFNQTVNIVAVQDDGDVIVGGVFTNYKGVSANRIIRLNSDGSRDTSFDIGTGFNQTVNIVAVQDDGDVIVGGAFTNYKGVSANRIIRLNSDGSRDTSFDIGTGFIDGSAYSVKIQTDGKILVGGTFSTYKGVASNRIIRLNADGSRDTSFVSYGFTNGEIYSIQTQNNGKILVGGGFIAYSGVSANNIIRLNSDGTRDTSFNIGIGLDSGVSTIDIKSNEEILIGGTFTNYQGFLSPSLVSLYGDSDIIIVPNSTNTATVASEFTTKGYTQSNGDLIGSKSFSLSETNGSIPVNLNLKNNNIKLSIPAETQFKKADNVTNYDGIVSVPIPKTISSIADKPVLSAFKVGSSESLKLVGGEAILSAPVSKSVGDPVIVYYSENNGATWYPHTITSVSDVSGQPTVSFTTTHFTDFAILDGEGMFTINYDAASTTSNSVTLNISTTPPSSYMRFSNDGTNRSAREAYATSKSWTLSAGYGSKTVYAQFDVEGDQISDAQTSDTINYTDGSSGGSCVGGEGLACLNLEISAVDGYCQYGKNLDLGQRDQSYSAFVMSGDFLNLSGSDSRYCDGRAGKSPWTLDISASNLVTSGDNVFTIPNTAIEMFVATPQKYLGSTSFTFGNGDFANQWANLATTKTVFEKTSDAGSVGKLGTDSVDLRVNVPANQAIGAYQSTITIQVPVMTI